MSATISRKLRTFIRQGEGHLESIDATLRRIGVTSLKTEDYDFAGDRWALFEDEVRYRTLEKAVAWVHDLDDYVAGYLEPSEAKRITRHPRDLTDLAHQGVLIENARIAIRARLDTLRYIAGSAQRTPAAAERDAAGGWPHLREFGLVEGRVLDGYLGTIRKRATTAQRRAAIGAAKELLEAAMKGAIRYAAPSTTGYEHDEFPQLWKRLKPLIQHDPAADPALGGNSHGVVRMLQGLTTTVAGVAETHNKVGTGHGRPTAPKGLKESHTVLVVDTVYTFTRFITARLGELFK